MAIALFACELGGDLALNGALDTDTASAIANSGTVYIAAGDLSGLTLAGGTWAIAPSASASVSGSLTLENATLLNGYDTTLNVDGGTVAPDDNTSLAPSSIENYGTIDCSDGGTVASILGAPALYKPGTPTASVDPDGHTIDLTWTDSGDDSRAGFQVEEEDVTAGTNFALYKGWYSVTITPWGGGDYSATVPWLSTGDEYRFRVRAIDSGYGMPSDASGEVSTTDYNASYGGTYTSPEAPTDLTAQPTNMPSVSLCWNNDTSVETGYNIYRSETDSQPTTPIATLGVDETSYVDTDVSAGQTFYYWVSAVYSSAEDVSGPVSATLPGQVYLMTVTDTNNESGSPLTVDQGQAPATLYATVDSAGDMDFDVSAVVVGSYSGLEYEVLGSNGQPLSGYGLQALTAAGANVSVPAADPWVLVGKLNGEGRLAGHPLMLDVGAPAPKAGTPIIVAFKGAGSDAGGGNPDFLNIEKDVHAQICEGSRGDVGDAYSQLLKLLDTNHDGKYDPADGDVYRPIEIVGYSWGAISAVLLAKQIADNPKEFVGLGHEILTVVCIDPVPDGYDEPDVPANVDDFADFYQTCHLALQNQPPMCAIVAFKTSQRFSASYT